MNRPLPLLILGVLLLASALTLAVLSAGMEPCWPDCGGGR